MTQWLWDTLLMTSLLMLLVLLLRQPVARILGPSVAYWLWLLPAARLFMPSLEKTMTAPPADLPPGAQGALDIGGAGSAGAIASLSNTSAPSMLASIDWSALLLILWLGGAAMLFVLQMIRYSAMRDELLSDAQPAGEIDGIRIIESDRVDGPLAFGLLRRFIVLPENFTGHFSADEAELAIEHELSHHKSGDLLVNMLAFTVLCFNWFNPIAWMAWQAFRLDQEAACDARVLAGKDAQCRETYGRTLARAAHDGVPTFATALNSPKTIIERLRRMAMNNDNGRRRIAGRLGILAAIGVALPMTATIVPVWAHDPVAKETDAAANKHEERREIRIYKHDGAGAAPDEMDGDSEAGLITRKIEKDGATIVIKSNRAIDDAEVEKLMAEAEATRAEAERSAQEAEVAADEAKHVRIEIEREIDGDKAEKKRIIIRKHHEKESAKGKDTAWTDPPRVPAPPLPPIPPQAVNIIANIALPEISISALQEDCRSGSSHVASRSVSNDAGQIQTSVQIALCGRQQVAAAREAALVSLRKACVDLDKDQSLPANVRREVQEKIESNIRRLERDLIA